MTQGRSKPTRVSLKARAAERRPKYDTFGRVIDPGCPDWELCLEDAALLNLSHVPCWRCQDQDK